VASPILKGVLGLASGDILVGHLLGSVPRFAIPAVEPRSPIVPKKRLNTAIAGVVVVMVRVFGAFGIEYQGSPDRGRIKEEKR